MIFYLAQFLSKQLLHPYKLIPEVYYTRYYEENLAKISFPLEESRFFKKKIVFSTTSWVI